MPASQEWKHLLEAEHGQDLIEYGLLASLVGAAMAASLSLFSANVSDGWDRIASEIGRLLT